VRDLPAYGNRADASSASASPSCRAVGRARPKKTKSSAARPRSRPARWIVPMRHGTPSKRPASAAL